MPKIKETFASGVLNYCDDILTTKATSAIFYLRLPPHRWSATYNMLRFLDREGSLSICPVTSKDPLSAADQFNIE